MDLQIEGVNKVVQWFGEWPSFHDAEIIELYLVRYGTSILKIHTWNTTDKVDDKGYYITEKHAIVVFNLIEVTDLELYHFSQNVIFELGIEKTKQGYKITLAPCYGLTGFLEAKNIIIDIQPGKPKESIYN